MNEFFIKKNGLTMLYENIKFEKIFSINKHNYQYIIYSSKKIPKKGTKRRKKFAEEREQKAKEQEITRKKG